MPPLALLPQASPLTSLSLSLLFEKIEDDPSHRAIARNERE